MKNLRVAIGEWKNVTNPDVDGDNYRLSFTTVNEQAIGTPLERERTSSFRLMLRASRSRTAGWKLSPQDLEKVLFEIGKRTIVERLHRDALQPEEVVHVTSTTYPSSVCPFDPALLGPPEGASFTVALQPKVGFRNPW